MRNIKVMLAPTLEIAMSIKATATVEAEYGTAVVKGELVTLAHHAGEYAGGPAPCIAQDIPTLPEGSIILVSHVDLDTVGGIMKLTGRYTDDPTFWNGAAFIDLNGQHHVNELPDKAILHLQAYWAWAAMEGRVPRYTELTDVTDLVEKHIAAITKISNGDFDMISDGAGWAYAKENAQEECLVEETQKYRAFVTDDFSKQCPTAYYSREYKKCVPVTITFNTATNAITIGCCDGSVNACKVAQELWGAEAGGHPGVAGSPRGASMTMKDFEEVKEYVRG